MATSRPSEDAGTALEVLVDEGGRTNLRDCPLGFARRG
jgi:hypothetical protein